MAKVIEKTEQGLRITRYDWGYQISHGNQILKTIYDTPDHPAATEALALFARWKALYARVYDQPKRPSEVALAILASIVRGERGMINHPVAAKSLEAKGIIRRLPDRNTYNRYEAWELILP